jgi:molecular chaperone HscB
LAGLKGVELPGDGKTIDDPELLMEAMEAREALQDADTPDAIDALAARSSKEFQEALTGLGSLFLANEKPAIRKALLRLRYLEKFAEEARVRRMNLERSRT